jgi:hypothetical protein
MERWSISFWTILPLTNFEADKPRKHVLVQSIHGKGAYVQIDKTCKKLQVVCEKTGVINADVDLSNIKKKGWHNIIV